MTSSAHHDEVVSPVKPEVVPAPPQPSPAALFATSAVPTPALAVPALPKPITGTDIERLASNTARFIEQGGKALAAYLKPIEAGEQPKTESSDIIQVALASIGKVAEHWTSDPVRLAEAQSGIATPFVKLWAQTYQRMMGQVVAPIVPVAKGDKRYSAPDWSDIPLYDFLRQAHTIGATWAEELVDKTTDIDPRTRAKAKFYLRQIASATSPANFIPTNPELMRQTLETSGENLLRGATQLAEDLAAGGGQLRIRQTDPSAFELGVNVAMTPGKIVFRNDLIELIQYAPTTETVLKRPLLVIPPWINKFYILDLNAEKSFVRWTLDQGITVFMISWVNPDQRHRDKTFESYMREGIFAALEAIEQATGENKVNAIGYCVGGTLLSTSLAYMAKTDDHRIDSATFFAAQSDFTDAGDIQVFIDEDQIKGLEAQMDGVGYLEGSTMAMAFNMLRPNDLVWSYVVDNYLKGKQPAAFDLLYWNSDSTRLPARNHSFYLRTFYIENQLAKGTMELGGQSLDLGDVTVPIYALATREDHIAPAASVFRGAKLFGGPVRYVLGGSGHIAGVINPPAKAKYGYSIGPRPFGTLDEWTAQSVQTKGSWWPDWFDWLSVQAPQRVEARQPGMGHLPAIGDAPGTYVRIKS